MKKALSALAALLVLTSFLCTAQAAKKRSYPYPMRRTPGIVCLTFDDGYGKKSITKIINTLHEKGVKCTFFVIGTQLKAYPDLWRKAVAWGNEIAYHSMRHAHMARKTSSYLLKDIAKWNKTAKQVLGDDYQIPMILRLPGGSGHNSKRVMKLCAKAGYKVIGWNVDTMTGVTAKSKRNTNKRIRKYVLKTTRKNSIVLIHFDKYNANALPYYIDELKAKFTLGTVSQALGLTPVE